jgi:polar amino acid transport system substrate-binding protein
MNTETYRDLANHYYRKILGINLNDLLRYAVGTLLILVIGFFLFRACSSTVVERDDYKIGRDPSWLPLQLFDKERNMSAFTSDLLFEIARRQKIHLELFDSNSDELIPELHDGFYDGILSSITPTSINRSLYEFSDPIFKLGPVLIVKNNSSITSLKDLNYKIIGIRAGSPATPELQTFSDITVQTYQNILPALFDLEKGTLDAVLMEALPAHVYLTGLFVSKFKIVTEPLTNLAIHLVARRDKHDSKLIERFNDGLKSMQDDGSYEALLKKWSLPLRE